jgi:hypothetical protein
MGVVLDDKVIARCTGEHSLFESNTTASVLDTQYLVLTEHYETNTHMSLNCAAISAIPFFPVHTCIAGSNEAGSE